MLCQGVRVVDSVFSSLVGAFVVCPYWFSFQEEQTADIIANDLGLIAHKQMIGDSSEMKTLGKHDVKINGCEVQGQDTSNFSNSCLNPEHEGNIQNADKVQ